MVQQTKIPEIMVPPEQLHIEKMVRVCIYGPGKLLPYIHIHLI